VRSATHDGFMTIRLLFGSLLVGLAALGCSSASSSRATHPTVERADAVAWRSYDDAAFEDARQNDKIVLVDVGIEGCTACRWMYEDTYRNPAVVKRLRESFVTISVDADVQPDLGARFEAWGWPATIIMTPDREQVFALKGSRSPEVFAKILDDIVTKKRQGQLRSAREAPEPHEPSVLRDTCTSITRALDANMNTQHGGWTDDAQYIQGPAIEEAFLRAKVEGRPDLRAHALKTLDGYAKMLDPVWGGVFVAAHEVDFTGVIVEKRLVQEAEAMRSFALAYSATHEEKWRERAAEIDRYVTAFLMAPDGTFYSTQQDEAPHLPPNMTSGDYFKLPDAERRKYGIPPVDHAVYTDQNGQAIEAYAMLFEATGDRRMLERATRAADALLATRLDPAGFVKQTTTQPAVGADVRKRAFRPQAVPYLTAQAHFATALVALHRVTGEQRWLESARGIMSAARTLEDAKDGGFYSSPSEKSEKPVYENVVLARALHAIGVYMHAQLDRAAERTITAVGAKRGAVVALAAQDLALGPVEISITGGASDPRGVALYRAALAAHEPRKAVHWDTAHKYPSTGAPALYVCTKSSCSSPIRDPARVAAVIASATTTQKSACD
jgi:uncharacterized protein